MRKSLPEPPGANWLAFGRTYNEQRFSPLNQVSAANQTTPGETWDYNSNMDIVLADLDIDEIR